MEKKIFPGLRVFQHFPRQARNKETFSGILRNVSTPMRRRSGTQGEVTSAGEKSDGARHKQTVSAIFIHLPSANCRHHAKWTQPYTVSLKAAGSYLRHDPPQGKEERMVVEWWCPASLIPGFGRQRQEDVWVQGQCGLQSKSLDIQKCYTEEFSLKKQKREKKKKERKGKGKGKNKVWLDCKRKVTDAGHSQVLIYHTQGPGFPPSAAGVEGKSKTKHKRTNSWKTVINNIHTLYP